MTTAAARHKIRTYLRPTFTSELLCAGIRLLPSRLRASIRRSRSAACVSARSASVKSLSCTRCFRSPLSLLRHTACRHRWKNASHSISRCPRTFRSLGRRSGPPCRVPVPPYRSASQLRQLRQLRQPRSLAPSLPVFLIPGPCLPALPFLYVPLAAPFPERRSPAGSLGILRRHRPNRPGAILSACRLAPRRSSRPSEPRPLRLPGRRLARWQAHRLASSGSAPCRPVRQPRAISCGHCRCLRSGLQRVPVRLVARLRRSRIPLRLRRSRRAVRPLSLASRRHSARAPHQLHGYVDAPAFSPDGKPIAFLYVEGATRPPGRARRHETRPPASSAKITSKFSASPLVPAGATRTRRASFCHALQPPRLRVRLVARFQIPRLHRRRSARRKQLVGRQALHADRLTAGTLTSAASVDAPSSQAPRLLAIAKLASTPTVILAPADVSGPLHGLQIAVPRWSPDGKAIAFIGGLMSDQGVTGGDVWIVPSSGGQPPAGGQPVDLTPGRPASAIWIAWDDSSTSSSASCRAAILASCACKSLQASALRQPLTRPSSAFPPQSAPAAPEAASPQPPIALSLSFRPAPSARRLKSSAPGAKCPSPFIRRISPASASSPTSTTASQPAWGNSVSLTWNNDNFHVQGWLLLPAHYDPAKKYPLLVEVHGGPASSVVSRWNGGAGGFSATAFSALGYFVLMPNPRGSYGQGEAFTQANRKDFGYGDLRDILAGVDTVLAKYSVDPNRVGISGWSYGGFMAMFAVTQTHRFRAAVAGAGISDWLSYYGENSIDQWMIPYFGASVYDDPQVYAQKLRHQLHQERHHPHAHRRRRPRRRMSRAPVLRVLACPARSSCPHAVGRLPQRGPRLLQPGPPPRCAAYAPSTGLPATCRPTPSPPAALFPLPTLPGTKALTADAHPC